MISSHENIYNLESLGSLLNQTLDGHCETNPKLFVFLEILVTRQLIIAFSFNKRIEYEN